MNIRYDTVLFDADNTLLDFTRSEYDALRDCLLHRGFPNQETIISDAIATYSAINDGWWKRLERKETTRSELAVGRFRDFIATYGLDCEPAGLAKEYMDTLATKSYMLDGAYEVCRRLYPYCRLYLITNGTTYIQHGRWDPTPLAPMFQNVFISEDIGFDKPSRAYFDYVVSHIPQFDATRTLVVGDSLSSDISGGINAGLDTCWYNPMKKEIPSDMKINYVCSTLYEIEHIVLS